MRKLGFNDVGEIMRFDGIERFWVKGN